MSRARTGTHHSRTHARTHPDSEKPRPRRAVTVTRTETILVPFVANATRGGAADVWWDVMTYTMNASLPVWLNVTYEWIPRPFDCPFVSAIDDVWCFAAPPLCWEVYVDGVVITDGLVNATAKPGQTVSWVYQKYDDDSGARRPRAGR
jgi:hypothetical protein